MALNFPDSPTLNQVYTDTTSGFSYQWDGVVWQSYTPSASSNIRILDDISGSFDGTTTTFALLDGGVAVTPANSQQIRVTLGGIVQEPTTDYVVAGSNVVFSTAPGSGLSCSIVSLGPALPVDAPNSGIIFARQEYNPTGVQTSFTFTNNYTSGYLEVYHNGVKLVDGPDFTATNGSTFSLTVPAQNGDVVEAVAYLQTSLYTLGNYTNYLTVVNNATVGGILTATSAVVGSANTFTEDLVVNGDARITGILTIGTSSITLDGTNNEVNVGTGVTIHHTNGVQVGGNTVHSSGLFVNQINVTGVVTATTFYGDGSALTGVDSTQIVTGNTSVQTVGFGTTGGQVILNIDGTERLRVNNNGYTGIGTTVPATFLHISSNDISARGQLSITGSNSNNPRLTLYRNNTFIGHIGGDVSGSDSLIFSTESTYPIRFSPGGTERARVSAAGSFSIGDTDAQGKLYVNGSTGLQNNIVTRTGYASNNAEVCARFNSNYGYNGADGVNARIGVYGYGVSFNEGGAYGVYGAGYGNVGNGGGVGVYGVSGSSYSSGGLTAGIRGYRTQGSSTGWGYGGYFETESSLYSTNGGIFIQVNTKGSGHTDSIGAIFNDNNSGTLLACSFRRSGSQVGRIETTASSTAYQTSSDYRLKENVVPLTNAIERLKNIPVHRFNFIIEPEKTVDGFIAHEVQPFVPEAVSGVKDEVKNIYNNEGEIIETEPVYQGIDQAKLVPLLTAALQEALDKIDALQARLDAAGL
jgi:hypothetical protein